MEKLDIPRKAVYRLSLYLRCLQKLRNNRQETVSSEALAKVAGVKPTQLRKDLGYFGQLGTRGLGYNVENLYTAIDGVLGPDRFQSVILVGVGNLGAALLNYRGFNQEGFQIVAAFDKDPTQVSARNSLTGIPVLDSSELGGYIRKREIKMAILAVPEQSAQEVANEMVKNGVQAILNFSPAVLQVPDEVVVNHVSLAVELEALSFFVT